MRHLYRDLTNDNSASESSDQAKIDERVAEILLMADDAELLIDIRFLNGQPGSTKFFVFYKNAKKN